MTDPVVAAAQGARRRFVDRLLAAFRAAGAPQAGGGLAAGGVRAVILPLAGAYAWLLHRVAGDAAFLPTEGLPWVARLEAEWPAVRAELDRLRAGGELPALVDVIPAEGYVADRRWRMLMLRYFGRPIAANCALCPRTAALLETVPGLLSASFSVLQPGARLAPHQGVFAGILRYHLGLLVPEPAEACAIRVAGRTHHWREGGSLLFDDTRRHEAWNETGGDRVVLLLDLRRPLPLPLRWVNDALIALMAHLVMPGLVRGERAAAGE